ncbi:MAG: right-handed parallel beta-helix repeat-containing protein, partial [Planctomycetota bacterium]
MATGDRRVRFYSKKLLGLTALKDRFLDIFVKWFGDHGARVWPRSGFFEHVNIIASGPNQFDLDPLPVEGVDNSGHFLFPTTFVTNIPFENLAITNYHVAFKHELIESGVESNPRTGASSYVDYEEVAGHKGVPDLVTVGATTITFRINNLLDPGGIYSHAERTVRVWKNVPASSITAQAFEDCVVVYGGGHNTITTTAPGGAGLFGQVVASDVEADYTVCLLGPRVCKLTNLAALADHAYVGFVTGGGAGNPIAGSDTTGQWNPISFADLNEVIEVCPEGDYKICVTPEAGCAATEPQISVLDGAQRMWRVQKNGYMVMDNGGADSPRQTLKSTGGDAHIQNVGGDLCGIVAAVTDAVSLKNLADAARSAILRLPSTGGNADFQNIAGVVCLDQEIQITGPYIKNIGVASARVDLVTTGVGHVASVVLDSVTGDLVLDADSEVRTAKTLALDLNAANSSLLRLDSTGGDATLQNINSTLTLEVQNTKVVKVKSPGGSSVLEVDSVLRAAAVLSLDDTNIVTAINVSDASPDNDLHAQFTISRLGPKRNLLYAVNVVAEHELQFNQLLGPSVQSGCEVSSAGGFMIRVDAGYVTLQGQRFYHPAELAVGPLGAAASWYVYLNKATGAAGWVDTMAGFDPENLLLARVTTSGVGISAVLDLRYMMDDLEKRIDIYAGNARGTHFATLAKAVRWVGEMVNSTVGATFTRNFRIRIAGTCIETNASLPIVLPCDGLVIEGTGKDSGTAIFWDSNKALIDLNGKDHFVLRDVLIAYDAAVDMGPGAAPTRHVIEQTGAVTSDEVLIQNVLFKWLGTSMPHGLVYNSVGTINGLVVDNCTIDTTSDYFIVNIGDNALVRGCRFTRVGSGMAGAGQTTQTNGIVLSGEKSRVEGNTISGDFPDTKALVLIQTTKCRVSGNSIHATLNVGGTVAYGVVLNNASGYSVVDGNEIVVVRGYGIYVDACDHASIRGNTIYVSTTGTGIHLDTGATYNAVTGNSINIVSGTGILMHAA